MDTVLPQKFLFILDRNLAKANCTENHVCTSCDTVVLDSSIKTEGVLLFFICIYLYIYRKLSPKWKNVQEQKVFSFSILHIV